MVSAISGAGRRGIARAGLRGPLAAPPLAPIHSAASSQLSKQTSAPARRRRRSQFCNRPEARVSAGSKPQLLVHARERFGQSAGRDCPTSAGLLLPFPKHVLFATPTGFRFAEKRL